LHETAIYPSFPPHPKKMRYGFHILNRDAPFLPVIVNPYSNPRLKSSRCYRQSQRSPDFQIWLNV